MDFVNPDESLNGRQLAISGHKAIVDDLVYELLRKMVKGGVP